MTHLVDPCRAFLSASSLICLSLVHSAAWSAGACTAQSPAYVTPVVELYTSEGCNSCPPADRWLSRLKADPGVMALAFHVDYWDRLGWKDRFASPAYTQRQAQQQRSAGARFSYTPQIVIDGVDRPQWPGISLPLSNRERAPATVDIALTREGNQFSAVVRARAGAPAQLAAYWAVTEDDHRTSVKAGENDGATLQHDFVVRQYAPVASWTASTQAPMNLRFDAGLEPSGTHAAYINLVVVDAETRRPIQALKLGC